jgi:hypothetical protein
LQQQFSVDLTINIGAVNACLRKDINIKGVGASNNFCKVLVGDDVILVYQEKTNFEIYVLKIKFVLILITYLTKITHTNVI